MATSKPAVSVTECPICIEDFKNPRLLPCTHSYCFECLNTLAGGQKRITCPECRKEIDVPERGILGFPENRYVEDLLRMKKTHQCIKHFLPINIFCDNEDCQVQICPTCAAVKHNGHKLIDVEDKAVKLKINMVNTKEKAREISLALGAHLDKLNKAADKVKKSASKNLDAVDSTREQLHKKIQELHEKVQAETEEQKMNLLQNQKNELAKLEKAKDEVLHSKTLFDGLYMDIEKSMTLSNNEIIQVNQTLQKSFMLLKINEVRGKNYDIETKIMCHDQPELIAKPHFEYTGKLRSEPVVIQSPDKLNEIKGQEFIPEAKFLRTIRTELDKWPSTKMCVSKDGRVVLSGKIGDENWLKGFNFNGNCLWQIKMGKVTSDSKVRSLSSSPNNEQFYAATKNSIQVRNLSDGQKIYEHGVNFICGPMFWISNDMLLVDKVGTNPKRLVKLKIKYEPVTSFETIYETAETGLENPYGYMLFNSNNKQLFIITSWKENTIKAIDYSTGNTEWSITGKYEGKQITPHGVCCDAIGNVYIADGTKRRILLVSPEGNIMQKVIDLSSGIYWVGFTEGHTLIANVRSDSEYVQVYQIEYRLIYP